MTELKQTRTIEEIVGYVANDGTQFETKEECKKYETTANAVIKERFKKLVVKEIEGCVLGNYGTAFFNCNCDEDWYYALVEIKNSEDLNVAMMYAQISDKEHNFTEDMIGKKIIVAVGEGIYPKPDGKYKSNYNYCYIHGTIEEQIEKFKTTMKKFEESDENDT